MIIWHTRRQQRLTSDVHVPVVEQRAGVEEKHPGGEMYYYLRLPDDELRSLRVAKGHWTRRRGVRASFDWHIPCSPLPWYTMSMQRPTAMFWESTWGRQCTRDTPLPGRGAFRQKFQNRSNIGDIPLTLRW